ncbi:MAG: lamin tail domain-containing protein [Bacteroidia bacterium]
MKNLRLLILSIFAYSAAAAQLNPGDIAFMGVQTDNPDAFAFVSLVDIPGNTEIKFTDNGYSGTALFTNESTITWTAPAGGVPLGTVMIIRDDISGTAGILEGPGSITGALSQLSLSGDQILAYVGDAATPGFIAAISTNLFLDICNTTGTGNTNNTCLPSPLVEGIDAISVPGDVTESDNIFVDFNDFSGTADDIRAIIMDPENWTYDDDPLLAGYDIWPAWQFSFVTPDPSEINFQDGFITLTEGSPSVNINFSISPLTSSSQTFTVTLSGLTSQDDILTNPAIENNEIVVNIPSGVTTASFSLAAIADVIPEGVETGTLTITSLSSGLIAGSGNALNFEIVEAEGISFLSFSQSTYNVNEGDGTATITVNISPATAESESFIVVVEENGLTSADYSTTPPLNLGIINASISAGGTSFSFIVNLIDDVEVEGVESLNFSFDELSPGLSFGTNASATLNLSDNDGVSVVSGLYINEVMASNTNTIQDENGEFDDWIEIYNGLFVAQDLAGLTITDEEANPSKYLFPSGDAASVVPSGGFVLVWADNTPSQGVMHTNFTLSAAGEYVGLYASNGELIHSVTFTSLGPNESYGRENEASENWLTFAAGLSTPNASNATSSISNVRSIISSVYPVPSDNLLTISLNPSPNIRTLHIFDTNGKLILNEILPSNSNSTKINTAELPAGTYLLRVGEGRNKNYSKFTVAH